MTMPPEDLLTVAEDLEWLAASWKSGADAVAVRHGSAILRRLLLEGELGYAWRSVGFTGEPAVEAVDIASVLDGILPAKVSLALCTGGTFDGMTVAGVVTMHLRPGEEMPRPHRRDSATPIKRLFKLNAYLNAPCAIVDGSIIRRHDLIKYIALVRGGVHLGRKRKEEKRLVDRVGPLEQRVNIRSIDGLFFEALSIGQALGESADCLELVRRIRSV